MPKTFKVKVKLAVNEGKKTPTDQQGIAELELPMEIPTEKQPLYTTNRIAQESENKKSQIADWLKTQEVDGINLMNGPVRSRLTSKDDAEKVIEERRYMTQDGIKSVPQVGKDLSMSTEKLRKRMQVYGVGRKIGKQVYVTKEEHELLKTQEKAIQKEIAKLAGTDEIAEKLETSQAMVLHWIKRLSAKEEETGRLLPLKFPFIEISGKYFIPRKLLNDEERIKRMKEDIPKQSMRLNYEKEAKGRVNVGDFLEKHPDLKSVTVRGYIRDKKLGTKEGRTRYLSDKEQKQIEKYYGDRAETEKNYNNIADFSRKMEVPRSTAQNWVTNLSDEFTLTGAKIITLDGTSYIEKEATDTPEKITELRKQIEAKKTRKRKKTVKAKTKTTESTQTKTSDEKTAKPKTKSSNEKVRRAKPEMDSVDAIPAKPKTKSSDEKTAKPKTKSSDEKTAKPKTKSSDEKTAKPKTKSSEIKSKTEVFVKETETVDPPQKDGVDVGSKRGEMEEHEEIPSQMPMNYFDKVEVKEEPQYPILSAAEQESLKLKNSALDRLEDAGLLDERNDIMNIENRMNRELPTSSAKHQIHNMYLQLAKMDEIKLVSAVIFRERRKLD